MEDCYMTWICYVEEVSSFRLFKASQINWLRKYIEPKNSDLAGHYKGSFLLVTLALR
jgi:hypothetical protein